MLSLISRPVLRTPEFLQVYLVLSLMSEGSSNSVDTASIPWERYTVLSRSVINASLTALANDGVIDMSDGIATVLLFPASTLHPRHAKSNAPIEGQDTRKTKEKRKPDPKQAYGMYENILLTDAELDKVKNRVGEESLKEFIDWFSTKKKAKDYKYKQDYRAIVNWGYEAYYNNSLSKERKSSYNSSKPSITQIPSNNQSEEW